MASSNIKLFDENKGNMLNDTEFNISTQRLNGLQTGVASSQLQNKAMYQASLVAYAIAQLMLANGQNANDTDAVSTFVNNLLASIVQKVADKATKQDITDGIAGKWISSELFKSNNEDIANTYLKLAGGTMLGNLFLNADPTSALQAVTKNYVDSNCAKLKIGSYTGTGDNGQSHPCSLTFDFVPKLIWFVKQYVPSEQLFRAPMDNYGGVVIYCDILTTSYSKGSGPSTNYDFSYAAVSSDRRTVYWYNPSSSDYQLNSRNSTYYYIAFA